jgi:hypothetical protein
MALPGVVGLVLLVEAAKQPGQIFGITETFLNDGRSIGIGLDVFVKPTVVAQDVINQGAQEGNVAPRADADVKIAHGRHAGEARIYMDQGGAFVLGLHGPAEADRLSLRHVRPHEQNAIAVLHVLLIIGGRAAAE